MAPSSDRGTQVLSLTVAFTVLATITVVARVLTRLFIVQNVGKDDYVMILSWICAVVCGLMIIFQAIHGLGNHVTDLTTQEFSTVLEFFYWSIPFYYASLSLTKLTIVFQTLRFVAPSQRRSRIACYALIVAVLAYLVYTVVTTFLICLPAEFFWNKTIEGSCLNFLALWFVNAALNIITDIAILVVPLRVVVAIQLPRRQKLWLIGVFALGGITCIASILRLQSLYVVSISTDPTFDNVAAAYWSDIEMNLAIVCACLPTLRPLLSKCTSSLRDSSYVRSRVTGGPRPGSTPGMLNNFPNQFQSLRSPTMSHSHSDEGDIPLKKIMVTTEIKQNFTNGHEKDSISSEGNSRTFKDSEFV